MITASNSDRLVAATWSMADLLRHLGNTSAERIRVFPPPGQATERDVDQIAEREGRHFELIDGILLEKTTGWYESLLAVLIATEISNFVRSRKLGQVLGADGALQILTGMVRIPDVSFISRERLSRAKVSRRKRIPLLVPDLAIEVLSKGNTKREMQRKLKVAYLSLGILRRPYLTSCSENARVRPTR